MLAGTQSNITRLFTFVGWLLVLDGTTRLNGMPGGLEVDRRELAQILAARECIALVANDVLDWAGSDLSGKYSL